MSSVLNLDDYFRDRIQPAVDGTVQVTATAFRIGVTDDAPMNVHRRILIRAGHTSAVLAVIATGVDWNSRSTWSPAAVDDFIVGFGAGIVTEKVIPVGPGNSRNTQRIEAHVAVVCRQQHGHQ